MQDLIEVIEVAALTGEEERFIIELSVLAEVSKCVEWMVVLHRHEC